MAPNAVFVFTFILMFVSFSSQYLINRVTLTIDPYDEQCFFERLEKGTYVFLHFVVTEGGFQDIAFKEIFPNNTINIDDRIERKNVRFESQDEGIYTFCLNNEMSTLTPKIVKLVYVVIEGQEYAEAKKVAEADKNVTVDSLLGELNNKLREFSAQNELLSAFKHLHHQLNERTNSWILWWSIFEAVAMISLTVGQIYFVKKFFEVRRII